MLNHPKTTLAEMEEELPGWFKRDMANKKAKFYVIDAASVAKNTGLGAKRINNIMTTCFYKLAELFPLEESIGFLKQDITDT